MADEKIHLSEILAKMKDISEKKYAGDFINNVLNIFADLSMSEQRDLLKGLINICFVIEDQINENNCKIADNQKAIIAIKTDITGNVDSIKGELRDLETYNKKELIKLKSWFVKTLTIAAIVIFVIFLGILVFSNESGSAVGAVDSAFNVLKMVITGK